MSDLDRFILRELLKHGRCTATQIASERWKKISKARSMTLHITERLRALKQKGYTTFDTTQVLYIWRLTPQGRAELTASTTRTA